MSNPFAGSKDYLGDGATSVGIVFAPGGQLTVQSGAKLMLPSLPTVDPGRVGQIWNNAGVLSVSSPGGNGGGDWILALNTWNDSGVWDDAATWND